MVIVQRTRPSIHLTMISPNQKSRKPTDARKAFIERERHTCVTPSSSLSHDKPQPAVALIACANIGISYSRARAMIAQNAAFVVMNIAKKARVLSFDLRYILCSLQSQPLSIEQSPLHLFRVNDTLLTSSFILHLIPSYLSSPFLGLFNILSLLRMILWKLYTKVSHILILFMWPVEQPRLRLLDSLESTTLLSRGLAPLGAALSYRVSSG